MAEDGGVEYWNIDSSWCPIFQYGCTMGVVLMYNINSSLVGGNEGRWQCVCALQMSLIMRMMTSELLLMRMISKLAIGSISSTGQCAA